MKFLFVTFLLSFAMPTSAQDFYGTTDVSEFRKGRDAEFRDPRKTPLLGTDFETFKGLNYFENNSAFRLKATFAPNAERKLFLMPTSAGVIRRYEKVGLLSFTFDGKIFSLGVFQMTQAAREKFPEYKDLLFVPFRDLTNGDETYVAGRYIDFRAPKASEVILDFNLAYNPNCAYGSERYSCPIPPRENFLRTKIAAGEKKFGHSRPAQLNDADAKLRH